MKILFFGASSEIAVKLNRKLKYEIYGISKKKFKHGYAKLITVKKYSKREIELALKKFKIKFDHVFFFNGSYQPSLLKNFNKKDFNSILDINFNLLINSSIIIIKNGHLKKNGSICFISSAAGSIAEIGNAYYSLTKNLLNFSVKIFSKEFKKKYRFNCISLGFVNTKFSKKILNYYSTNQKKIILSKQNSLFIPISLLINKIKYICEKANFNGKIIKIQK